MSARNLVGDATAALVALLGLDPSELPVGIGELRAVLERASIEERIAWERAERQAGHDHDRAVRCRRWAAAIEHAWELARHELDVASGRRRAGWAA